MRINIDIDDALMAEAMEALGVTTKRKAVTRALQDVVRVKRRLQAWDGLRWLGWHGDLDEMRTSKYVTAE